MKALIFDVETTGTDTKTDRIIEFAGILIDWDVLCKMPADSTTEDYMQAAEYTVKKRFKPDNGVKVSLGAYFKHGISDQDLEGCESFGLFVKECLMLFNAADIIITYNGMSFDIPIISNELNRYNAEIVWEHKHLYDSFQTETKRNSNSLDSTFSRYYGSSMAEHNLNAHDALSDVIATTMIFNAQNVDGIQDEIKYVTYDGFLGIDEWEGKNIVCFKVGKYRGIPVREIIKRDPDYISWILSAAFPERTKAIIRRAVNVVQRAG